MNIDEIAGFLVWLYDRHLRTLDGMLTPHREALETTKIRPYLAPRWLERLARQDLDAMDIVRQCRNHQETVLSRSGELLNGEEARHLLIELVKRQTRSWERLLKPYMDELVRVNFYRPPDSVLMPDGRVMRYVGPTMADMTGKPYEPPKWLVDLLSSDLMREFRSRRVEP